MTTLTNYDATDGDAYKIIFSSTEVDVKNVGGESVLESLVQSGVVEFLADVGFFRSVFGNIYELAMVNLGLPYNDSYVVNMK